MHAFAHLQDSLLNPPPSRPRPKETLRHPPGRTQGAIEGGSEGEGERQGRDAGRREGRQPEYRIARESQQASLPEWTTPVHAEATAGKRTHTQGPGLHHLHPQSSALGASSCPSSESRSVPAQLGDGSSRRRRSTFQRRGRRRDSRGHRQIRLSLFTSPPTAFRVLRIQQQAHGPGPLRV